jgi:hypothetical protein
MTRKKNAYAGKHGAKKPARREYTEAEKIAAVSACMAHGGLSPAGIQAARDAIGSAILHVSSIARWRIQYGDKIKEIKNDIVAHPDMQAIVQFQYNKAVQAMQEIVVGLNASMLRTVNNPEQMDNVPFDRRALSSGIIQTKLKEAIGHDPEMDALLHEEDELLRVLGYPVNLKEYHERYILSALRQEQQDMLNRRAVLPVIEQDD